MPVNRKDWTHLTKYGANFSKGPVTPTPLSLINKDIDLRTNNVAAYLHALQISTPAGKIAMFGVRFQNKSAKKLKNYLGSERTGC